MNIAFTKHAREKFLLLKRHKVLVSREQVLETVRNPERLDYSRLPLLIAQRGFDKTRVLRVVYQMEKNDILIITFYPGKRSQYEK